MRVSKYLLLSMCFFSVGQAALYAPLDEKKVVRFTKPAVSLPPPLKRGFYASERERSEALKVSGEASRLEGPMLRKGDATKLAEALLKWHWAAQFGESSACARMYFVYHNGEYGFSPNSEYETIYLENKAFWYPPDPETVLVTKVSQDTSDPMSFGAETVLLPRLQDSAAEAALTIDGLRHRKTVTPSGGSAAIGAGDTGCF